MRSLNLDQLRTLLEVVEGGSFSAAARRLNLSQPAVSQQIRELEGRFGVQLVERLGKRAFATPAGRDLVEHAHRLAHEADLAAATMRRHREGWLGRVRIGTGATYLAYFFTPILRKLREQHPNIELVITVGTTQGIVDGMLRNEIDIGAVTLPVDERLFEVTYIRSDPMQAVLPTSYPDIPETVTPDYMARQPLILEYAKATTGMMVRQWLAASGVPPRPAMELDMIEAIKTTVAAGLGVSILPFEAVLRRPLPEGMAVRPLSPPVHRRLGLIRRRDKEADPALHHVREALLELANT
ncbi:LysR family transcriptional regulator [Skermanella rosea]|uniref:LysR family transcriptional regulator n=1 Tax=Skermanella rosea TaxID=1817965 RepID=UPI0019313B01|nr:LysR family transcriptional regulator [Skermanella rosea]UEM02893.1 LysR family transcriptional regulator [Skermanella rosea]